MGYREIVAELEQRKAERRAELAALMQTTSTTSLAELLTQRCPLLTADLSRNERERLDEAPVGEVDVDIRQIEAAEAARASWDCSMCPARRAKAYLPDPDDMSGLPTLHADDLATVARDACAWPTLTVGTDRVGVGYGACQDTLTRLDDNGVLHAIARAGVGRKFWSASFGDFDRSAPSRQLAAEAARAFVEAVVHGEQDATGLCFIGDVGCGKTYLAAAMVRALVRSGVSTAFACVPEALERRRRAIDTPDGGRANRAWRALEDAQVAILDDLGAEKGSEWAREQMFALVNSRYEAGKPVVVTTNCDLAELVARLGERIGSRLIEMVTAIEMGGPDRRIEAARTRLATLNAATSTAAGGAR